MQHASMPSLLFSDYCESIRAGMSRVCVTKAIRDPDWRLRADERQGAVVDGVSLKLTASQRRAVSTSGQSHSAFVRVHHELTRTAPRRATRAPDGFRFSKAWRGNRVISHVEANLLADGIKPERIRF